MRPNLFTAWSTAIVTCASSDTSKGRTYRSSPATSRKASRTFWTFLPVATTRSPAFRAALAVPAPIPLPAPVMSHVLLTIAPLPPSLQADGFLGNRPPRLSGRSLPPAAEDSGPPHRDAREGAVDLAEI